MGVDFLDENLKQREKGKKMNSSTPILDNFSRDLVKMAEEGKIDPIIGRDAEVLRIAEILTRKKKNNVVIVVQSGNHHIVCMGPIPKIQNTTEPLGCSVAFVLEPQAQCEALGQCPEVYRRQSKVLMISIK